ncbi:MAG: LON peptidase substrate-binding domain-containing protein [Candidatus Marinimicrobia bacterium]|nr:LON peptidase substrate-binding domain-containing protein [Candidatus Neomarinimicrobiota bacterium]
MTKKKTEIMEITAPAMRILPVDGIIPLPHVIFPVNLREEKLHQLVQDAMKDDKTVGVFTRILSEDPGTDDEAIYEIGAACSILKVIQTGDGSTRVLLRGLHRIAIDRELESDLPYRTAVVTKLKEVRGSKIKSEAYVRTISELFQRIISISPVFPEEIQDVIFAIEEPSKLSDLVASSLNIRIQEKYQFLTGTECPEASGASGKGPAERIQDH